MLGTLNYINNWINIAPLVADSSIITTDCYMVELF